MSYKLLNKCPVCSSQLKVVKLSCDTCGTIVESDFSFSKFESLSEEQLKFAEVFIKNRGSIKDVEKEMGISYPTVRGKLDDVIRSLGYSVEEEKTEKDKNVSDLLDKLEKGEIDADEALNKMKGK
jgi:hypothetical protein